MADISSGVAYAPLFTFSTGMNAVQSAFCFDQAKRNLLHLYGDFEVGSLPPVAESIHEYMDAQTRTALQGMPLDFMRFWESFDPHELALTHQAPPGYLSVMRKRAHETHARLSGVKDRTNVIFASFRRAG